jgi:hypothetical protein
MTNTKLNLSLAAIVLLAIQIGLACGQSAKTVSKVSAKTELTSLVGENESIVGSWYLTVTSATAPEPFKGEITFSEGGGLVASGQGDVLLNPPPGVPPVATPGHGAWTRTANREYLFTFRQIFYNGDGSYAGGAKVRNSASVNKNGNEMIGQLVVDYYNEDDEVVFTGTGTFTAVRITAELLIP